MGVARQVGEHRLRTGEWALGIDEPPGLPQRLEECSEGLWVGEMGVVAKELEAAGGMGGGELVEEEPPEQLGEHAHG